MKKITTFVLILPLISIASAFTLHCYFKMSPSYTMIGSVYECLTNQTFGAANQTITGISGQHLSGKTNSDVKLFSIESGRNLTFVPKRKTKYFRNLIALRIVGANIETIHADDVAEIEQLQWLRIQSSGVRTISSWLFSNTPNVRYVGFNYNQLEHVGHDLFTPLNTSQIQYADFQYNICIDQYAYNNHTLLLALIENLRDFCPFHHEEPTTTTTISTTPTTPLETPIITTSTSTMSTTVATTVGYPGCLEGNVERAVCDLQDTVRDMECDLKLVNSEFDVVRGEIGTVNSELRLVESELRGEFGERSSSIERDMARASLEFERELASTREEVVGLQDQVKWLTEELLRLSAELNAPE